MSAATLIWGIHPWQRGLVHVADLHELTSRVLQRQMLTRALLQLAYRGAVRQRPMSRPSRRGVAQNSVMLASSGDGGGATWTYFRFIRTSPPRNPVHSVQEGGSF